MPKKEMDYSKCVIYKIQHKDNNDLLYVGHTTNFIKRKNQNKTGSLSNGVKYNYKLYQTIRENGGWDDFNMIVVKEFPCENKQQATTEEDRIMREMKATMNTLRAFLTDDERKEILHQYQNDNKELIKERKIKYCQNNKEKIQEYKQQYRQKTKEHIEEYGRQYYEKNKEKIREYKNKNKEHIQQLQKRICLCECGKEYTHQNKRCHIKTKFHMNFLNPCIDTDPPSSSQPEFVSS